VKNANIQRRIVAKIPVILRDSDPYLSGFTTLKDVFWDDDLPESSDLPGPIT